MTSDSSTTDALPLPPYLAALERFEALPAAARLRERTYQLLSATPGASVVDVGCGAGRAVAELAERGIAAVGVDVNPGMITLARSRFPDQDFRVVAASDLPFSDGALAGYRADKVLHEIADTAGVLGEARRVLAPGGRIVVAGQDWDLIGVDAGDVALTRAIVHAQTDALPAGMVARRLCGMLADAGFVDVTVEAHTGVFTDFDLVAPLLTGLADAGVAGGVADRNEADEWLADLRIRGEAGRLRVAVPILATAAVRP